jgi:hypothetical protein
MAGHGQALENRAPQGPPTPPDPRKDQEAVALELRRALLALGWEGRPFDHEDVAHFRDHVIRPGNTRATRVTPMVKVFSGMFGTRLPVEVKARLVVFPEREAQKFFDFLHSDPAHRYTPTLHPVRITNTHPHEMDQSHMCFTGGERVGEILTYGPENIGTVLATVIDGAFMVVNPGNLGSAGWYRCSECTNLEAPSTKHTCEGGCGRDRICTVCWEANRHYCQGCGTILQVPEGLEPWQWVARRFQWPASAALYQRALLVGAGTTGSWAKLVLDRTFARVDVLDPDTVSHPHGGGDYISTAAVWGTIAARKVEAIERQQLIALTDVQRGFATRTGYVVPTRGTARFGEAPVVTGLDLLILCPDNPEARSHAEPILAARVLDVRGTPQSCVFWALPGTPREHQPSPSRTAGIPIQDARGREPRHEVASTRTEYVCSQCGEHFGSGQRLLYWHFTIDEQNGGGVQANYILLHEPGCVEAWARAHGPATPPPAPFVQSVEDASWWETWRASLRGYPAREACGHDAVSMEAGTITARFLAWWVPKGMPVGIWEIPFGLEVA